MTENCYPRVKGVLQSYQIDALREENLFLRTEILKLRKEIDNHGNQIRQIQRSINDQADLNQEQSRLNITMSNVLVRKERKHDQN